MCLLGFRVWRLGTGLLRLDREDQVLVDSFMHAFVHSLAHSFTHSFNLSVMQSLILSLPHVFMYMYANPFIIWLCFLATCFFNSPTICWLIRVQTLFKSGGTKPKEIQKQKQKKTLAITRVEVRPPPSGKPCLHFRHWGRSAQAAPRRRTGDGSN